MISPLPIFVINLDRVPERWGFVRAQFEGAGLGHAVQRASAIDARAPGFDAPGYAPHRWQDRWELEPSEQAIFESHRALWIRVADTCPDGAVICEDDILISQEFAGTLQALDLARFGIVKLDGFSAKRRYGPALQANGLTLRPIREAVPSAACYAISRPAAQKLVQDSQRYCATLDDFLFARRSGTSPVQLFPAVAVQAMCCVADAGRTVPGQAAQSERAPPQASSRKAGKGPLAFRLLKELRRIGRRLAVALGADRRNRRLGGIVARPDLAADLPPYIP